MDSIFKISKRGTNGILIEGLEKDNSEYIAENGVLVSTRNYAYSQTVTINTLTSLTSNGTETFEGSAVIRHSNPIDSNIFTLTKDGLYLIAHIIIPTKVWFDMISEGYSQELDSYAIIYFYDETDGTYKKYLSGVITTVTLSEILAADYREPASIGVRAGSTVIRSDKNTFIMYKLNDCFNTVCKNILTSLPYSCNKSAEMQSKIEERDILWMGINVIKYHIELLQLFEAQRFLESITYCGSCNGTTTLTNIYSGCGCNN